MVLDELQRIDMELSQLEKNLEEYPKKIFDYEKELEASKQSLTVSSNEKTEILESKSRKEQEIAYNEEMIKKAEQKLFEIKTHKEYEALQKEITETKRKNSELEERLLEEMEILDGLEIRIKQEQEELTNKESEYGEQITIIKAKIEELNKLYKPKKEEKEIIISNLDTEILPIYERIKKRNGRVLALARNEVCMGCNMNIPPQLFNEVLTLSRLIQCPNCQKILYLEEEIKSEAKTG
ncbi:MAG: zinc ribbon domain-containing protein [Thermodesulfobacteriota bacterium]